MSDGVLRAVFLSSDARKWLQKASLSYSAWFDIVLFLVHWHRVALYRDPPCIEGSLYTSNTSTRMTATV